MLYIIGLGLGDEQDITLRGLAAVRRCRRVVLEAYTSVLLADKSRLVEVADREKVEEGIDDILEDARDADVAFLVVGDPFGCGAGGAAAAAAAAVLALPSRCLLHGPQLGRLASQCLPGNLGPPGAAAERPVRSSAMEARRRCARDRATTHADLLLRARELGVAVRVVHNASILTAAGACGLQLYRFGETVSVPFFTDTWRPDSFYDKIKRNRAMGLHTLCLLDIQVKEPTFEALCRGRKEYKPPQFMTVSTAVEQLLEIEERRNEGGEGQGTSTLLQFVEAATAMFALLCREEMMGVGLARVGTDSQCMVAGSLKDLLAADLGPPLHSLVLPGELHVMESEMLRTLSMPAPAEPNG
eukprot:SM000087S23384  [mRNA]  locus=s87:460991:462709:+ [translate_table: standard]